MGNAVRHTTAGPDCLTIEIDGDQVIVAVHDSEPDDGRVHLSETAADPLAESGRGLWLVQTLARRWYVWRPPPSASRSLPSCGAGKRQSAERQALDDVPPIGAVLASQLHQLHFLDVQIDWCRPRSGVTASMTGAAGRGRLL
ncbi:ATP-binding protein [Streptomyces sp. NPDC052079]|uniref:ATP-binding protein n=1 Tax=Streptomyces sp. NPDC052079 TaxID=3155526 RepID=UPI003431AD0E